jgi:hypothetical protein
MKINYEGQNDYVKKNKKFSKFVFWKFLKKRKYMQASKIGFSTFFFFFIFSDSFFNLFVLFLFCGVGSNWRKKGDELFFCTLLFESFSLHTHFYSIIVVFSSFLISQILKKTNK